MASNMEEESAPMFGNPIENHRFIIPKFLREAWDSFYKENFGWDNTLPKSPIFEVQDRSLLESVLAEVEKTGEIVGYPAPPDMGSGQYAGSYYKEDFGGSNTLPKGPIFGVQDRSLLESGFAEVVKMGGIIVGYPAPPDMGSGQYAGSYFKEDFGGSNTLPKSPIFGVQGRSLLEYGLGSPPEVVKMGGNVGYEYLPAPPDMGSGQYAGTWGMQGGLVILMFGFCYILYMLLKKRVCSFSIGWKDTDGGELELGGPRDA